MTKEIRRKIAELGSVFHGASRRRDPCCLYSIEPAEAAASIQATASAPTPLLGKVGFRAAQAVTRERLASCDAREAARAGKGGGEEENTPLRATFCPPGPIFLSKMCPFVIISYNIILQVAPVAASRPENNGPRPGRASGPEMARFLPAGFLGLGRTLHMASGSHSPCGNPWETQSILRPLCPSKPKNGNVDADS